MSKPLRLLLLGLAASCAAVAPVRARADVPIEGTWECPYGKIKIEKSGDRWVGKLVEVSHPGQSCKLLAGYEVLHGSFEDDIFIGQVRQCYAEGCEDDLWAFALAAVFKNPERIVAAVGETKNSCRSQLLSASSPRRLLLQRPSKAAEPVPAPSPTQEECSKIPEVNRLCTQARTAALDNEVNRAIALYRKAEDLESKNAKILGETGYMFRLRGERAKARKYYLMAIGADANYADGFYFLACLEGAEGRPKLAMEKLSQAARLGCKSTYDINSETDLASLHGLPGFDAARRQIERNSGR